MLLAGGRKAKKTVLRGDEQCSYAIDAERLIHIAQRTRVRRNQQRFEAFLNSARNTFPRSHPKISIGRSQDEIHQFAWQPFSTAKPSDSVPVIAEQPCLRSNPEKSFAILRHGEDRP